MFVVIKKRDLLAVGLLLAGITLFQLALWQGRETLAVSGPLRGEGPAVVILDAGHGGFDGGAVAEDGTQEADINLAVARELEEILQFLGTPTAMTRREDVSLQDPEAATIRQRKVSDLHNRTDFVNQIPNGILISIHQNSLPSVPSVHGAQVFYTPAGEPLAQAMQALLNQVINPERHKQAKAIDPGIYLMHNTVHPAVLVECGFLSNAAETRLLRDEDYQRRLALTIAAGYFRWRSGEE